MKFWCQAHKRGGAYAFYGFLRAFRQGGDNTIERK
jgi:hypothetical protein